MLKNKNKSDSMYKENNRDTKTSENSTEDSKEVGPFHKGERDLQIRAGVNQELQRLAKRAITNSLPIQHQIFFTKLPMVFVAVEDQQSNVWSSILMGDVGFIEINDVNSMTINAQFLDVDPLVNQLKLSSEMGILGFQFETRRRNRVSAIVSEISDSKITLEVKQCYGNCPKYIQRRQGHRLNFKKTPVSVLFDSFDDDMQQFISDADSLFIASQYIDESKNNHNKSKNRGVDSSYRGGMPGFIKVLNETTFLIPDYIGNNFFNTMGNISQNPKTGIQFLDFENGHRIMLTGTSEIIWADDQELPFEGVDRMIRFTLDHGYHLKNSLPYTWEFTSYSPFSKAYAGDDVEV